MRRSAESEGAHVRGRNFPGEEISSSIDTDTFCGRCSRHAERVHPSMSALCLRAKLLLFFPASRVPFPSSARQKLVDSEQAGRALILSCVPSHTAIGHTMGCWTHRRSHANVLNIHLFVLGEAGSNAGNVRTTRTEAPHPTAVTPYGYIYGCVHAEH